MKACLSFLLNPVISACLPLNSSRSLALEIRVFIRTRQFRFIVSFLWKSRRYPSSFRNGNRRSHQTPAELLLGFWWCNSIGLPLGLSLHLGKCYSIVRHLWSFGIWMFLTTRTSSNFFSESLCLSPVSSSSSSAQSTASFFTKVLFPIPVCLCTSILFGTTPSLFAEKTWV